MEIKLERADIVIVASAHNPSIVSPQWLREKKLIVEDSKQFVHTPDFSLFDSETFSLVVDRERLQITAKKQDRETLKSLASVGSGYINLLTHVPYRSLGLNFVWLAESTEGEVLPKIEVSIGFTNNLSSILTDHELIYGCIIYARKDPYLLKLIIEPRGKNSLVYNFNYHHGVERLDKDTILDYIGNFMNLYEKSKEIVEKTCLLQEEKEND